MVKGRSWTYEVESWRFVVKSGYSILEIVFVCELKWGLKLFCVAFVGLMVI